ncbi:MAG: BatD family protein [Thiomicrorhabdus sp.]|nr:BatD family protein [Thiomicrorhabdus sp.]
MVNTIKNRTQKFSPPPTLHPSTNTWRYKPYWLMLMILMMLPILGFTKTLTVSADRQTIEMGDIITLSIQADFQTLGSQLDLDSLKDQFELLGRQQNNQISMINGQFSSNTQWQITLLAKQIGELIVPPLRIEGVESKPYKIKVLPEQKKSASARGNYFSETSLSKAQVYLQEEVLYSLKFYFLGAFQGNIRPPIFENSLTVMLKEQDIYGKQINGKNYTVYEWQYAVYPQQSGSFVIKGPIISGIQQLMNRQKGIQEMAEIQTLTILPEPTQLKKHPNDPWLPAKSLRLSEIQEKHPTPLRVGDSLTRTLILEVTGLRASQIPLLSVENKTGFKVYDEQPVTQESQLNNGVHSQQKLKQTIIFTQSGKVTLPEQRIDWFNTQTETMETATLKGHTFTVLPALNASPSNPATPKPSTSEQESPYNLATPSTTHNVSPETSLLWPVISTLLSLAWLATLILWRRQVKQLKNQPQPATQKAKKSEPTAPKQHTLCDPKSNLTPHAFYTELRRVLQQEHQIQSFSELSDNTLKHAINQLEKHLFYQETLADNTLESICEGLKKLTEKISPPPSHKGKLASLYGD